MEDWYLPLSITPGLGLLILSTANLIVMLNNEISAMIDNSKDEEIITRKISQLRLLNTAMILFYVAVAFLLISAIVNGLYTLEETSLYVGAFAIISALIGLFTLILYSIKALAIRQDQFKNKLTRKRLSEDNE